MNQWVGEGFIPSNTLGFANLKALLNEILGILTNWLVVGETQWS